MLEVRNVTKRYGKGKSEVVALNNVSVRFGDRGLVVVLGKSGSGKSTLLNLLGGLDRPTEGEVVINGRSMKGFTAGEYDAYRNTYVGIVFQEFNLIDDITVFENIDMTMKLQEKSADVNTVDEVLGMVGLSNLGYRKPSELSGGQRQRVALARALLKKPEIILADEPTGSLDSNTSEEVFESLKKIAETKLVIVVTHERELAAKYGERVISISDGRIVSDVVREEDALRSVKELSERVIEVSGGGRLTAEQLNARLAPDKVNYIGLSHDKDRIALAYPETVDTFYARPDSAQYRPTDEAAVPDEGRPFRLSKGRLPWRDAFRMGRKNIKRTKKRYRFLTFLTVLCFTFVCVSFIVGSVNIPRLVAKSAFEPGAQPLVSIAKIAKNTWGDTVSAAYTERDFETLKAQGFSTVVQALDFTMTPVFVNRTGRLSTEFALEVLTGSLEGATPEECGLQILAGSGRAERLNEIIISDLAAFELVRSGYVGKDKNDVPRIMAPETVEEVAGTSVRARETGAYYKIAGIFRTNFESYRSILTASRLDTNSVEREIEFMNNRDFLYGRVFAAVGFAQKYAVDSRQQNMGVYDVQLHKSGFEMEMAVRTTLYESFVYDPSVYESGQDELIWVKDGLTNPPPSLADDQIIVPQWLVGSAMGVYNYEGDITKQKWFIDYVTTEQDVTVYRNFGDKVFSGKELEIVGVCVNDTVKFGEEAASAILRGAMACRKVYVPRGPGQLALASSLDRLPGAEFLPGSAKADVETLTYLVDGLEIMAKVFFWVAFVLLIFSFLIVLNYISVSVRFRTKEVAVYRVVGAKAFDVAKIFLTEGLFITIRTTVGASILAFLLSLILNESLTGITSGLTLVNFNFLHVLFVLFVSALFVLVASMIPIWNITHRKPVDAVKLI